MKFTNVFDYEVANATYSELMDFLLDRIEKKKKTRIFAINPEKVMIAEEDVLVKKLLLQSEILIPDGIGIVKASKMFNTPLQGRLTGYDTFIELLQLCKDNHLRAFLYGASEEVVSTAVKNITEEYGSIVAGYSNGFTDDQKVIDKINESGTNILFVALGSPKQEIFMSKNFDYIEVQVMQGVGGSFDVYSGKVNRAPKWMQKINLEWFHRLLVNPTRIGRQVKLFEFYKFAKRKSKEGNGYYEK